MHAWHVSMSQNVPPVQSTVRRCTSTRPEDALLLCCARVCTDAERSERIRALLQHDLDWEYLLSMAQRHALIPLLFRHLNTTCPEAVPSTPWQQLRQRFHSNARRNLSLTGELLKLLRLLATHNIPAIPFKGPVLAVAVYGDLTLRQFVDLDLLVQPQAVLQVKTLLRTQGYQAMLPLRDEQEAAFLRLHHECAFAHPDGVGCLDLHWALNRRSWPTPLELERVWEGLVPVVVGGQEVLTFAPEDTLLALCIHGTKHLWLKLQWLCDVARLLGTYGSLDWEHAMAQAHALGSARMLYLGLRLAPDLLGVVLPEEVWRRVQTDPAVPRLAAWVRTLLFQDAQAVPGILHTACFSFLALETLGRRSRYLCDTLLTPTTFDLALVPLPTALFPLYYAFRPLRLSGKYTLRLLQRLLGP